jgi:Protein of unknown function (DUF1214)
MQQDEPQSPHERANWLPTPDGDFRPILRMYEPGEAVLRRRVRTSPDNQELLTSEVASLGQLGTRALTAAVISARPPLASEKNMPVFGSVYSSLSIPA